MNKIKIVFFASLVLFTSLVSANAYSTILFDLEGTCSADCARFGIADGTAFDESGVLGLFDGTDTSAGADLLFSDIEHFSLFGIDFLLGNSVLDLSTPTVGFVADNVLSGFILYTPGVGANGFCYNYAGTTCENARFDTIIADGPIAAGFLGHGIAEFTLASVPEPASIALLGLGLAGIGFSRKKK